MSDYFDVLCVLCGDKAFSAFAVEVGPLARLNEVGPVEGMKLRISFEYIELNLP